MKAIIYSAHIDFNKCELGTAKIYSRQQIMLDIG